MAEENKPQADSSKDDVAKNKVNAILSYLGILILVPLLSEDAKKSPFAKFHLNQGLVLLLAEIFIGIVWVVPILGWIVGFFGGIFLFVIWIMALIGAINGKMERIPLLGNIELIK